LLDVRTTSNTNAANIGKQVVSSVSQTDAEVNIFGDQADGGGPSIVFNHQNVGNGATGFGARITGYRVNAAGNRYMGVDLKYASATGQSQTGLRLNHLGQVGIGTTSVGSSLHIKPADDSTFTSGVRVERHDTSGQYGLFSYAGGAASITAVETTASSPVIRFQRSTDGSTVTESARIDSSGRLLVGTSTSLDANSLIQTYKSTGSVYNFIKSDSLGNSQEAAIYIQSGSRNALLSVFKHSGITNPCPYLFLQREDANGAYYWTDNSGQFRISSTSGHVGTTSGTVVGTQTSDERIKNILGPVTYGLDEIKQLDPVSYALKSDPEQVPHLGFIAQQVLPLVPESVFDTDEVIEEGEPTKLGMEYVSLIPVLVNAIKELSAEVDALKAQLQAQ
jgi:hypothetical protein